jgi:hypothetical protein
MAAHPNRLAIASKTSPHSYSHVLLPPAPFHTSTAPLRYWQSHAVQDRLRRFVSRTAVEDVRSICRPTRTIPSRRTSGSAYGHRGPCDLRGWTPSPVIRQPSDVSMTGSRIETTPAGLDGKACGHVRVERINGSTWPPVEPPRSLPTMGAATVARPPIEERRTLAAARATWSVPCGAAGQAAARMRG